jgi:hypothetical protein
LVEKSAAILVRIAVGGTAEPRPRRQCQLVL